MLAMPTLKCCLLTNYRKHSHGRRKNFTIFTWSMIRLFALRNPLQTPISKSNLKIRERFLFLHCILYGCARCNCLGGSGVEYNLRVRKDYEDFILNFFWLLIDRNVESSVPFLIRWVRYQRLKHSKHAKYSLYASASVMLYLLLSSYTSDSKR